MYLCFLLLYIVGGILKIVSGNSRYEKIEHENDRLLIFDGIIKRANATTVNC